MMASKEQASAAIRRHCCCCDYDFVDDPSVGFGGQRGYCPKCSGYAHAANATCVRCHVPGANGFSSAGIRL